MPRTADKRREVVSIVPASAGGGGCPAGHQNDSVPSMVAASAGGDGCHRNDSALLIVPASGGGGGCPAGHRKIRPSGVVINSFSFSGGSGLFEVRSFEVGESTASYSEGFA